MVQSISEFVTLIFQIVLGVLFDLYGRKIPLVTGMALIALSIGAIPLGKELYPWFLICRIMLGIGSAVGLNVPLLPDYVEKEYLGRAQGITQILVSCAFIFSSTGLMQIASFVEDLGSIYYVTSAVILAVTIFLFFGIKDVVHLSDGSSLGETK